METTIDGEYTVVGSKVIKVAESEARMKRIIRRDLFIVALIYGSPLIYGWGLSVMGGIKFNPHLALLCVPLSSLLVAGIMSVCQRVHK